MKTRILTAVVMAMVLAPIFIFSDTVAYPILTALMGVIGTFEMTRCIGVHRDLPASVPGIAIAAVMPFVAFLSPSSAQTVLFSLSAVYLFWLFAVSIFSHGKLPVDTAGMLYFGWSYVVWGFFAMTEVRYLTNGKYLFLLPFVGAWVTDSFAYFTGRAFGRHKLIPDVSPKKTVEGAVGGVVFAVLGFLLYGFITEKLGAEVSYGKLMLLAVPVSLVSMIGDLAMSVVKRRYQVKDYGKLLPGHGGILDRFDSALATALMVYLLVGIL